MMGRTGRAPGTRELVINRTPYVAIYRVKRDSIQIVRRAPRSPTLAPSQTAQAPLTPYRPTACSPLTAAPITRVAVSSSTTSIE
jgi:hypothetical protein